MFHYNLLQKPNFKITKKTIDSIFLCVSKEVLHPQNGTINIVFVDDPSIQSLNKQYRGIDKTTDVLSFHYFSDFTPLTQKDTAGEIILSETKIISQGSEYGL